MIQPHLKDPPNNTLNTLNLSVHFIVVTCLPDVSTISPRASDGHIRQMCVYQEDHECPCYNYYVTLLLQANSLPGE